MTPSRRAAATPLRRAAVPAALAALVVVHGLLLGFWLKRDRQPPAWDQSVHLQSALRYRHAAGNRQWEDLFFVKNFPGHPPYPPLTHDLMALFMAVGTRAGAPAEDAAVFVNFLFLGLLALGAYGFISKEWGPGAGLAAAALVSFAPPTLALSRQALVDLPLAAWVVAAYAAWRRSEGFRRQDWSLALGAAGAAGLLTKWTFGFYVIPIVAVAARQALRGRHMKNIFLALAVSALASFPWYALNLVSVLPKIFRAAGLGAQEGDPTVGTLAGWLWYLRFIWSYWRWEILLPAMAGAVFSFRKKSPSAAVLAAWFLSGWIFWTFVSNKDPRYIFPAAAALPLLAAGLPFHLDKALGAGTFCFAVWMTLASKAVPPALAPDPRPWPLEAMAARTLSARGTDEGPTVLTLVSNHAGLNGNNLSWTVAEKNWQDRLWIRTRADRIGQLSEFVLVKTGDLGPPRSVQAQLATREEIFARGSWFIKDFHEVERWPLPDGSEAVLYKRAASTRGAAAGPGVAGLLSGLVEGLKIEGFQADVSSSVKYPGELSCRLSAARVDLGVLTLRDVRVFLDGFLADQDNQGRPRLLNLRRLNVESARWSAEDATAFLRDRARALKNPRVRFLENDEIEISGRLGFLPIRARARVAYRSGAGGPAVLETRFESLSAGFVPLPVLFLGPLREQNYALKPNPRAPFTVHLSGLRTVAVEGNEALEIGGRP